MTDLLGPADAGAVNTLTTTTDVSNPAAGDTWFQDCTANNPATGSNMPSKFMDRLLQQVRRVIRLSGIPLNNSNDDMLGQAIQSGASNWAGTFGGTANALTATLSPAPTTLIPRLTVKGTISAANTGAMTLNVNGIGAIAATQVSGAAFVGGEFIVGQEATWTYNGTEFVLGAGSNAPGGLLRVTYYTKVGGTQYIQVNGGPATTAGATNFTSHPATKSHIVQVVGGGGSSGGPRRPAPANVRSAARATPRHPRWLISLASCRGSRFSSLAPRRAPRETTGPRLPLAR